MANYTINRQQANRLGLLAHKHGHVKIHWQNDGLSLVVSYRGVARALVYTTGKLEVTDVAPPAPLQSLRA